MPSPSPGQVAYEAYWRILRQTIPGMEAHWQAASALQAVLHADRVARLGPHPAAGGEARARGLRPDEEEHAP